MVLPGTERPLGTTTTSISYGILSRHNMPEAVESDVKTHF